MNTFESIEAILTPTFKEEPLKAYFWEQSDVPSLWDTNSTEGAREGGGLELNDPLFGQHLPEYNGFPFGLFTNYNSEKVCHWEGHNCVGVESTIGHAAAAAASTAKSIGIPLIVVVPATPTHPKINPCNRHW